MCPAATLARASLLLCLVVGSRQLSITELAVPSAVQSGESVELACRLDGDAAQEELIVKWWWTPFNSTADKMQIYQRIGTNPGASMLHDIQVKDSDTIVLSEAVPADSGTYECEVSSMADQTEELREHQELTVFTPGTGPQLNVSEVEDGPDEDAEEDVLITCRAEDVAPAPDILLKINGEEFNMTEDVIGPDAEGLYDAEGTATLSKAEVDGAAVTCELSYVDSSIAHELYIATHTYHSGSTTTEPPEESTEPLITPDSLQNQSGDTTAVRASWALLFALSVLTQLPSISRVFNVILI